MLTVKENGGSNIPILEEGSYPAVCYMLVDIGMQKNERYGNSSRKVIIGWEVAGEHVLVEGEEKPRVFSARYTASLNEKSLLRRDLAAWRGRDFTEEELKAFDLKSILGTPCLIQIIHKEANGRQYANLASIMKLPRGMEPPHLTLEKVVFDLDESDLSEIEKLPEWIANAIKASESYQERIMNDPKYREFGEFSDDDELPF